jgi:hypothetical protein
MREEMVIPTIIGRGWLIGRVQDESVVIIVLAERNQRRKQREGRATRRGIRIQAR